MVDTDGSQLELQQEIKQHTSLQLVLPHQLETLNEIDETIVMRLARHTQPMA